MQIFLNVGNKEIGIAGFMQDAEICRFAKIPALALRPAAIEVIKACTMYPVSFSFMSELKKMFKLAHCKQKPFLMVAPPVGSYENIGDRV